MKYFFLCLCLFFGHTMVNAQTVNGSRIVWGPTPIEARLSYGFESVGFDIGKFSYSGIEQGVFLLSNKTGHTLLVKLTCDIRDYCGKTYSYNLGFTLKANETVKETVSPDATPCKSVKKLSERFSTVISNITVVVNSIVDLTEEADTKKREQDEANREKERLAKEKQAADAKEKERIAKFNNANSQVASTSNKGTGGSYYSNQKSTNTSTATKQQPTWQETNARINAENQQKYIQQQNQIAQQQKANKEAGDKFVSDANELVGMVGNMLRQSREQKEKKELRKQQEELRLQQERQEEQNRINELARYRAQRLELRKSFFAEFLDGGVPLSSQKIPVTELYYFTYVFDKATIAETSPPITLSNIFSVIQYADGTWPFKAGIIADIKKLAPTGTITLIGYFTTKNEAEEMRSSFLELASKSNFSINDIAYKGKKSDGTVNKDFWGNKSDSSNRVKLRMAKGDEDFWETGQAKKKAIEDKKKEDDKKKAAKKDDFWNN